LPSKKPEDTRHKGRSYEQQAESYLISKGYTILERNWQASHKEIDLIAQKDDTITFVEVKGARSSKFGHPAEKVDRRKQMNLVAAAERYISENDLHGYDFQIDLITIFEGRLEHYPNAFECAD